MSTTDQQPTINGQIVHAPGGGSNVIGELAYTSNDKAVGALA